MSDPTPADPLALGQALRRIRVARSLSQAALVRQARALDPVVGFINSAYSHWESGTRYPSPRQLLAFFRAAGRVQALTDDEVVSTVHTAMTLNPDFLGIVYAGKRPSEKSPREVWERWAATCPENPVRATRWR